MLSITRIFHFEACHYLPNYEGNCNKLHGHSYKLEVTVSGEDSPNTGMILDFNKLKAIVEETIIKKYDHSYLNDFFKNPTSELMVLQIANALLLKFPKTVRLQRVRLWETHNNYAEWTAEME